ncbi:hypothetical protein [Acidihalobacter prosperus]|uniref:hypothetical protein n=1 Tax=Acidihalobacter prosperus TaxID=160660 RepID=UPI0011AB8C11|nr:hypothetical protein [Acidihalobacter prosperus]
MSFNHPLMKKLKGRISVALDGQVLELVDPEDGLTGEAHHKRRLQFLVRSDRLLAFRRLPPRSVGDFNPGEGVSAIWWEPGLQAAEKLGPDYRELVTAWWRSRLPDEETFNSALVRQAYLIDVAAWTPQGDEVIYDAACDQYMFRVPWVSRQLKVNTLRAARMIYHHDGATAP